MSIGIVAFTSFENAEALSPETDGMVLSFEEAMIYFASIDSMQMDGEMEEMDNPVLLYERIISAH
jgi:hypothetical protein